MIKNNVEYRALLQIRGLLTKGKNKHGIPLENVHKTLDFIKSRIKEIKDEAQ